MLDSGRVPSYPRDFDKPLKKKQISMNQPVSARGWTITAQMGEVFYGFVGCFDFPNVLSFGLNFSFCQENSCGNTVDGRNPSPVDM